MISALLCYLTFLTVIVPFNVVSPGSDQIDREGKSARSLTPHVTTVSCENSITYCCFAPNTPTCSSWPGNACDPSLVTPTPPPSPVRNGFAPDLKWTASTKLLAGLESCQRCSTPVIPAAPSRFMKCWRVATPRLPFARRAELEAGITAAAVPGDL